MAEFEDIVLQITNRTERELASRYFDKYWLSKVEFDQKWQNILHGIFSSEFLKLPSLAFNKNIRVLPTVGGSIFESQSEFEQLQVFMNAVGDSEFVIVENVEITYDDWLPTRFVYPVHITWDEIRSGGVIGTEHLTNYLKDYFVAGDSGLWGEYVGNSYLISTETFDVHTVKLVGVSETGPNRLFQAVRNLVQLYDEDSLSELLGQELLDEYRDSLEIAMKDLL